MRDSQEERDDGVASGQQRDSETMQQFEDLLDPLAPEIVWQLTKVEGLPPMQASLSHLARLQDENTLLQNAHLYILSPKWLALKPPLSPPSFPPPFTTTRLRQPGSYTRSCSLATARRSRAAAASSESSCP